MEYINAKDVLPEALILEIQQYIGGSMIYIPQKHQDKKLCEASNNSRNMIAIRNNEIREKKERGVMIEELMVQYHLSYDSIKSIVYRRK